MSACQSVVACTAFRSTASEDNVAISVSDEGWDKSTKNMFVGKLDNLLDVFMICFNNM